jgi:hypothetical protein
MMLAGAVALAVTGSGAVAQVALPAGSQVTPTALNPATGAILASVSAPFSSAGFAGTLTSAVVQNGSTLDFYYQVANSANSLSSLGRETNFNFTGFNTSVFFRTDNAGGAAGFVAGTETPDTADRDNFGVVGFNFLQGTAGAASGKIDPGETSSILVVRTDATLFAPGTSSVINGGAASVATFMPVIPEPATIGLLGAATSLVMLNRRRR